VIVRWTADGEKGWVADLHSTAATVAPLRDADRLQDIELRHLMADLWLLLEITAGRLEVVLEERQWLRQQAREAEQR
jgi:hypothetical protein